MPRPITFPGTSVPLSRGWAWAILGIAFTAAAGVLWIPVRAPAPVFLGDDPLLVERGAELFAMHCATCHGEGAKGQVPGSPMGGLTADGAYLAPALNGSGHAWHHPPDALFTIVREGSVADDSPMRGWADRLSDEEIASVIAYFQSLWPIEIRERYRDHFGG